LELAHVIIAVVNHLPVRVKCNTCHSERNWRRTGVKKAVPSGKKKSTRSTQKATRAMLPAIEKQARWKTLMEGAGGDMANTLSYGIRETFSEGQIISHKKFGCGVIFGVLDGGKIRVCFVDGDRLLVHARS
jgi:hypothetical protein